MQVSPSQAIAAIQKPSQATPKQPDLLIAGATGVLGNTVLRRLVGVHRYAHTQVLARERVQQGMRQLSLHLVAGDIAGWPVNLSSDVAVVMFEPPRMFYERERALWTPEPAQLTELAAWLYASGASTLAVVLPYAQGTLPESLKQGLASLDEQALAATGFERLLIFRSAEKPAALRHKHPLAALAHWMLGIFKFMVPAQEQPVRPTKIAEIVDAFLQTAPSGITVVSQHEMWAFSQINSTDLLAAVKTRFDNAREIN
ncbi:hypothetical protein [Variovorax sp. PCZ-1]|uniref:hypothetical protein n=1 Tax=Variovorax sp. PCZ-1 TaxID=2835533 RepID=UPI001BCFC11E|nr:hypothetical protein [Variovorax sp. PCZ-1]MBS7808826.1 hypothetical protein [Variovorax sp. PCZ-1]